MDLTFNFDLRCVQPFFNDYSAYALGLVWLAGQAQQDFIPDSRDLAFIRWGCLGRLPNNGPFSSFHTLS